MTFNIDVIEQNILEYNRYLLDILLQDHTTGENIKVSPYQKYIEVDGHRVSRDLYYAFLLMNSDGSFANVDVKRCNETFDRFLELQEI